MKKIILFFLLFFVGITFSNAQELPNLKHVKLNKNAHYKATEGLALKVVDYLFATPINRKNKSRTEAGQFLLAWMDGTPDYTFFLEEKETNFFNTDTDLMLMYMASLTKFSLENPTLKDQKKLVLGAMSLLLPYLNQQADKKNWSRDLRLLYEAYKENKLESFLYTEGS
jgi:hypothetical protein